MSQKKQFELTETHLKLIRQMRVSYDDSCEFGAPKIDPQKPYGSSGVYQDIAEIIGIKPAGEDGYAECFSQEQENKMLVLHKETATALQVILATGSFEPGVYEADKSHINWQKV